MSAEFRQRKMSQYARIALKRKWMIILPMLAIGLAIGFVVFRLPDIYESSTLIVVKPSTLPNSVVPMITKETLTRELASISQVVTSRSSLQPLVEKYDLYKEERRRGEAMEVIIDEMRKGIKVAVINASRNDITNAFNITYRGRDPKTTQAVAAELASKYVNQQQKIVVGADAAKEQQGGGIQVVDPANLPEKPVAPKRLVLTAGGFGVGIALGMLLVLFVEVRRLFTIQTIEDAKHYTTLPVLASIPELMTPAEALAMPRRKNLALAAGVAASVVAVPMLAFVLTMTHVFERIAQ